MVMNAIPSMQTLSLLCGALSWRQVYCAAVEQEETQESMAFFSGSSGTNKDMKHLQQAAGELKKFAVTPSMPTMDSIVSGKDNNSVWNDATKVWRRCKPTIIYASRTHAQISQVIRQLKLTGYNPKVALLGSREQLCVHPKISKKRGVQLNHSCRMACKSRQCKYKTNLTNYVNNGYSPLTLPFATLKNSTLQPPGSGAASTQPTSVKSEDTSEKKSSNKKEARSAIIDIEELADAGSQLEFCPYFAMRETRTLQEAELICMPYNYLVDSVYRDSLSIDWQNSVVIVDEAHNLVCMVDEERVK